MKKSKLIVSFFFAAVCPLSGMSQDLEIDLLQAGPMRGYSEMREALIWVQTIKEAKVYAVYSDISEPFLSYQTGEVFTTKQEAYTAKLVADQVEPGRQYSYDIYLDDQVVKLPYETTFKTQAVWKWRGDAPDFTMLTGSCAYINQPEYDRPGKPYGGDYEIFEKMALQKADFMVWLGDNVYLREPDWNSWTGIISRYTHTRSLPELQPFLASTSHYAIWDDHDYGPDNSNRSFYNKEKTIKTFELFWGNPTFGTGENTGVFTSFQWGDADFFLLDNRWNRDPDELAGKGKTQLGQIQLDWLLDNLVTSNAVFKIVALGGQFLSDATNGKGEIYSLNGFEKERELIINFIYDHKIKNVIFITGDVHFSEISVLRNEGKPTIYDLTFSTLTAGVNVHGDSWNNSLRMPGTVAMEHNFGKINFSGPLNHRKLTVSCINRDNKTLWQRVIEEEK